MANFDKTKYQNQVLMFIFDEDKVIEKFCLVDDFCIEFAQLEAKAIFPCFSYPKNTPNLSQSEIITILILYHQSDYKNFKAYYNKFVLKALKSYFLGLVSYSRFLTLMKRVLLCIMGLMKMLCLAAGRNGIYFVDATKLEVCDNHRIKQHKVFQDIAKSGKTSMGWFFGLKLHLVTNELSETVAFKITTGNIADNNHDVLKQLFYRLEGKVFGDRGYLSKLFEDFVQKGLQIVAKLKTKTKKKIGTAVVDRADILFSNKRSIIETINDILKHSCDIWHTRHRSPINAIIHLVAGLISYQMKEDKPNIFI